jgi:hypothetical protein
MRDKGPAADTLKVYGTRTDICVGTTKEHPAAPLAVPYIRSLDSRMDFAYVLVSGYIPCFCTESRPW